MPVRRWEASATAIERELKAHEPEYVPDDGTGLNRVRCFCKWTVDCESRMAMRDAWINHFLDALRGPGG